MLPIPGILNSCNSKQSNLDDDVDADDDVVDVASFLALGADSFMFSPCCRHTFLLFVFWTTTVFSHSQKVLTFSWELCGRVSVVFHLD